MERTVGVALRGHPCVEFQTRVATEGHPYSSLLRVKFPLAARLARIPVRRAKFFATARTSRALTNQFRFSSISNVAFRGKIYGLSVCFNCGVYFDTPKTVW